MVSPRRKKIDVILLCAVLILAAVAVPNARAIGDWWHSVTYHPPAQIVMLADEAGMNSKGKRLFYRFSPQLVSQKELNERCTTEELGCTTGHSIYILQASTAAQANRNIVTAAHEMLHVAYSRLTLKQQQNLQPLLQSELNQSSAFNVVEELETYSLTDRYNEAHSLIGSEIAVKNSTLNAYYNQYFSDRNKTIEAYQKSPN